MRLTIKALAALTALLLTTGGLPMPLFVMPAFAEEADMPDLAVSVTLSPEAPSAPGWVEMSFMLTNTSGEALESVALTAPDGMTVTPVGDMADGDSRTVAISHSVTQSELDAGAITYIASCEADAGRFSFPVEAVIPRSAAEPAVELLRQISSAYASDTSSVTIVYTIRNTGSVPVADLAVSDPLGSFARTLERLEPGETQAFVNHVSIQQDAVSAPVLTYRADSLTENSYTTRLDEKTIAYARSMLDVSLTAGRSMFAADTAEVILSMTNGGNVDYRDIVIYDDVYGGVIADSIHLPAGGEEVEIIHSYPIRGNSVYRWRVTGVNDAGSRIDFITDTVEVYADEGVQDVLLTLRASTRMAQISRSGYVPFTLELTNIGSDMATRVELYESTLGKVGELAVVPTGEPTVCTLRFEVLENTSYVFSAVYTDPHGQQRTAAAEPIEVVIVPGGMPPESENPPETPYSGLSTQFGESPLFTGLLIGSCCVLAALLIALLVTSRRARFQRQLRAAVRKQRSKESALKKRPSNKK